MQQHHSLSSTLRAFCRVAAMALLMAVALPAPVQATPLTTLLNFDGGNGEHPYAGLMKDTSGNLYGTTEAGGASGAGTVFRLSPPAAGQTAWTLTTLADFSDGSMPMAELVEDKAGNLYGTTRYGGTGSWGTVFRLSPPPAGQTAWVLTTLADFNASNGAEPHAGLVWDAAGNLYGTTLWGGAKHWGTVFKLSPPAAGQTAWVLTTLANLNGKNGGRPYGGLLRDAAGNLYGTCSAGGSSGLGTVFKLSPPTARQTSWKLATLTNFINAGLDGGAPYAKLIMDASGNLYGTTSGENTGHFGTVFKLSPPAAGQTQWVQTTLVHFDGENGSTPKAGLVRTASGNLYGTGSTVFKLSPPAAGQTAWVLTTLASFHGKYGVGTVAGLVRDASGNLYGTTTAGGANRLGTVFKVGP